MCYGRLEVRANEAEDRTRDLERHSRKSTLRIWGDGVRIGWLAWVKIKSIMQVPPSAERFEDGAVTLKTATNLILSETSIDISNVGVSACHRDKQGAILVKFVQGDSLSPIKKIIMMNAKKQ